MNLPQEKKKTVRLKDELDWLIKGVRATGRPEDKLGTAPYRPGVRLCLERARLITQSYKETDGEPVILRRAKALVHILDNMTVYIEPWELIVGNFASNPQSMAHYPESFWRWLDRLIDTQYKDILPDEEDRAELHEMHKYWKNYAMQGKERNHVPASVRPYWFWENQGVFHWFSGARAGGPDYEKIFKIGLKGIIEEVKEELKKIDSNPEFYRNAREYLEKKRFLEAAMITLEAGCRFGKRYAEKARQLASTEPNIERRKELEGIADACEHVPENPPRSFYEALQCYWLLHVSAKEIEAQVNGCGERFDLIFYPFYKKDKEEGKISRQEAQNLVEHLWLKFNESQILAPPGFLAIGGSAPTTRLLTIGGITREGKDASNEMTEIVLDAVKSLRLVLPQIAFRFHKGTPQKLIYKVMELLRVGAGHIAFYNDEMLIPYFQNLGISLDVARDYGIEGCMRWGFPGKPIGHRILGGMFALPRCLELVLNQGVDRKSGKQIGQYTPDPLTFTSVEDVLKAYLEQVTFFMDKLVTIYNMADVLDEESTPQPYLSAMQEGCIQAGRDNRKYKIFPKTIIQPVGHITVANSLAAMKKFVFDEKKVSMAELLDALGNNWEGKEDLRQMFINDAPKFGNDDDYVDLIAKEVVQQSTQALESFKNLYGGHFICDGEQEAASYYAYSGLTGPTPDGRMDKDLFNDGTISPVIGTDMKGPTAVLKSVAKVAICKALTISSTKR